MRALTLALLMALPLPAGAFEMPEDEVEAQFISSNVVTVFYHELGHALIDVLQVPVLGKEEDAADTLSALLVHSIWDEASATVIISDTAQSYALYDAEAQAAGSEPAYSDEHSLDLQRYYNLICLFYGANPEARKETVEALGLPPERAERCEAEFAQAQAAWGSVLEGLTPGTATGGLRMVETDAEGPIAVILQSEIDDFNKAYGLPDWIDVKIAPCGQVNAFYSPSERSITICTEYAEDAKRIYESIE